MTYLSLRDVLYIHKRVIEQAGGSHGLSDIDALQSSINQPKQIFGEEELYPDVESKGAALCFFLVRNHPFVDGNKRTGYNAMEIFLEINDMELQGTVDEKENLIFDLAAGDIEKEEFFEWVREHTVSRSPEE